MSELAEWSPPKVRETQKVKVARNNKVFDRKTAYTMLIIERVCDYYEY